MDESPDPCVDVPPSLLAKSALRCIAGAAACAITACAVAPEYVKPTVHVPETYRFASSAAAATEGAALQGDGWWRAFGDPQLDALVEEGLRANHDLRIAALRVDEYAARVVVARAGALPEVGYGGDVSRQRLGEADPDTTYSALLSTRWELDLWGRLRSEEEAARAALLATEHARVGVGLSVASAIIQGYVSLLDLDQRLSIAQATVLGRSRNMALFQMRLDGGAVSDFEMMQVTAEYESAVASVPDVQRAINLQENALSLLLGRSPGPITRGRALATLVTPPVPSGVPSDLLHRRPDILQSEQQLIAANAAVGIARALYFPRLSLTGSAGGVSSEFSRLFSGPGRAWSFVGQLAGSIFAGGSIRATNLEADARREQALVAYDRTVQGAFRDVDDALASLDAAHELVASNERRVRALERAVVLSRDRYDNGYSDYLDVLDTERSLFSASLALTAARGDALRSLTDLYRALGGDWLVEAPTADAGQARSAEDVAAATRHMKAEAIATHD